MKVIDDQTMRASEDAVQLLLDEDAAFAQTYLREQSTRSALRAGMTAIASMWRAIEKFEKEHPGGGES